jgi:hypothetical protein
MYYVTNRTQFTYYLLSEYATGMQVIAPGDVYSFHIILLEMFTGRRPTDDHCELCRGHIPEIVYVCLKEEMEGLWRSNGEHGDSYGLCAVCADSYGLHPTFSYFHQVCIQNKMVFIDVDCSLCELKLRGTIAHSNFLLFSSDLHLK